MTHKGSVFRDLMIIETAIKTGMRRAKLANLLVRHINFGSGSLTVVGKQYQTDTGPMDILCISKDGKTLLVVELKKGRASDMVVGQTLRYMGYVSDELAEPNQQVKGLIIALSDDKRLRRALGPLNGSIKFYRYEIDFKLKQVV
jgi:RecB family endonuclease NucS